MCKWDLDMVELRISSEGSSVSRLCLFPEVNIVTTALLWIESVGEWTTTDNSGVF